MTPKTGWLALALLALFPTAVRAASDDVFGGIKLGEVVELHGSGAWAFGTTDGNAYLVEEPDGDFENLEMALILSARPIEKLALVAQAAFDGTDGEAEALIDYAFAEWSFSRYLQLRAGRAKHPFGIYGEVLRVGTLRPFLALPQSIYGPAGMVAETYDGLMLSGRAPAGEWEVEYSLYGGTADVHIERPWLGLIDDALLEEGQHREIDGVVGGQVRLTTPVAGLSVGLSAYTGEQAAGAGGRIPKGRHRVVGFQAEYLSEDWIVRGEVARHEHLAALDLVGGYLEIARRLGERWQLALRYDEGEVDIDGFDIIRRAPSLWRHREVAFGVGHWLSSGFVVRAEVHRVEGNRFATPERLTEALATSGLDTTTDLFQLGLQISF